MNDNLAYVYMVPRKSKVKIEDTVIWNESVWADVGKGGKLLGLEIDSPVEIWVDGKKVWPK